MIIGRPFMEPRRRGGAAVSMRVRRSGDSTRRRGVLGTASLADIKHSGEPLHFEFEVAVIDSGGIFVHVAVPSELRLLR